MAKVCSVSGCPYEAPCPEHPRKGGPRSPSSRVTGTRRWRMVRRQVLSRDGHRCYLCGGRADTVDHVRPVSRGGAEYDPANLRAACSSCNGSKSASLPPSH